MIEVRTLCAIDDLTEAVGLQQEIWGFADVDLLPVRLFVVATKIGGQVFGAFDGDRMVGFCLSIPGLKPGGGYYLHSHMLGVTQDYRNAGVGRLLKLAQRDEALAREVTLIEWTFDPLELKNAYFNIEKLGVVVRCHVYNQYGITSSALGAGLPTDRCVAEWYLDSPRVRGVLNGSREPRPLVEASIEVPLEIATLRYENPEKAREIQRRVSDRMQEYLGRGLTVIGLERSESAGTYLFGRWDYK
jgi:predicted GNAT superfamily acetyltransferase